MLPQLGFAEMIVLALLAIIVVGPKDLPKLMRTFGGIMAKIRGLGQEFKDAFEEMGAESEIAEMRKELDDLKQMGSMKNLTGDLDGEMRALDRDLKNAGDTASRSNPKTQIKPDTPEVKPEGVTGPDVPSETDK
jgi:sec-independent protein translocase protein TatB